MANAKTKSSTNKSSKPQPSRPQATKATKATKGKAAKLQVIKGADSEVDSPTEVGSPTLAYVHEDYTMRRPGRPRKSEAVKGGAVEGEAREGEARAAKAEQAGQSLRFEMRLPPAIVNDLELMRQQTGVPYSEYIRRAIARALAEDKPGWR